MDAKTALKDALTEIAPERVGALEGAAPGAALADLGLDSVAALELVGQLEGALGTTFSDEALSGVRTLGDLLSLVEAHLPR